MPSLDLENINVSSFESMPSPEELHARLPLSAYVTGVVNGGGEVSADQPDGAERMTVGQRIVRE